MADRQDDRSSKRRKYMAFMDDKRGAAPDLVVAASSIIDAMIDEAIAGRPYNSNIAARAVVALVLEEAAKELEKWAEPGVTLDHSLADEVAAIRALIPKE